MSLSLKLQVKLSQQLLMTPQLQQAIKLLQLSRLELAETLRTEIEQNPLLEEVDTGNDQDLLASSASLHDSENLPVAEPETTTEIKVGESAAMDDINWDDYTNHYDGGFSFSREAPDPNRPTRLDFITKKPNLLSHLQWQICHLNLTGEQLEITSFVIGNLNPQGFLEVSETEIAEAMQCSPEQAAHAVEIVQDLDPPGVGSRNVQESLLLQLKHLDLKDSLPALILKENLHGLEIKNYRAIAKATGHPMSDVLAAIKIITSLNPYPGRLYSDDEIQYIIPDVYVHKVGKEYLIVLNDEGLPNLKISSEYQSILNNEAKIPAETKGYLRDKLKDAAWLIKSIQQRQRTIYKVMESILEFQRDFFDKGIDHLRPLILRDVAEDIGMHESTVSRVTSNKYAHTPQGLFELKYFFSTAIPSGGGTTMAAESIRNKIRTMIKGENPLKPFTDNAISNILAQDNIKVARRTVAKYREQMGILPVKLRRQPKM